MVSRSIGTNMAQNCALAQAWVHENYERHPDGVVAKSVIYKHYEEYCQQLGRPVMETSIFGRVVKQVFQNVIIRRLGGRDNLKYHYVGIRAKLESPYAQDNTNTTRPKRKQRKREIIADTAEAQACLRWLHSNFILDSEGTVAKCDLYSRYTQSASWANEPLSLQQFTLVVINAFARISKRKVNAKSQQNLLVGISPRAVPVDPNSIPLEYMLYYDGVTSESDKLGGYREGSNTPDGEDDYTCRSPESEEGSDMSAGHSENSCSGELKSECKTESFHYFHEADDDPMIKNEPVDYSISTLRLKDEPIEPVTVKQEKMSDACYRSGTPERPLSHMMMESPTPSPSPPQTAAKRRIYKPRFHIDYHAREWSDIKLEPDQCLLDETTQSEWDDVLRQWLMERFEKYNGMCVNRDQAYSSYEHFCRLTNTEVLPLAHFDKVVLKTYPGTVTMMHPSGNTFYEGVLFRNNTDICSRVEQLFPEHTEVSHSWTDHAQPSMEMSSPGHSSSPIILDDDEDEENLDDGYSIDKYSDTPDDDLNSIPEVIRDGKFYLKNWLMDNFESVPEACVSKADAYSHYEAYARSMNQTPFEMNVFGKIVRQVFPNVSIRRLGGRVKSIYHYSNITAKPKSPLYALVGGKDPAQRSRKKEISTDNRTAELVIDWLKSNYEIGKDHMLMKNEVFKNYSIYCNSLGESPVSVNYFGKLVKHCFPSAEVRKSGGRTDPNWYYCGLITRDSSLIRHMSVEEYPDTSVCQYVGLPSPSQHSSHPHHMHHSLNTSNPIAVPRGGSTASALDSPYSDSPQILVTGMPQHHHNSFHQQYLEAQFLRHQSPSPFISSVGGGSLTPEPFTSSSLPHSPGLSRAFREGLVTHSRRGAMHSPHEPDVAPEGIFPRSPEDTSAQTCRSPAGTHHTSADPTVLNMLAYTSASNGGNLLSTSPTGKRGQVVPSNLYGEGDASSHALSHAASALSYASNKRLKHQVTSPGSYGSLFSGRS